MVHMEKKKTVTVGPWGGPGGSNWDDGIYDGVREITLTSGECIDSMQVVYEKDCKAIVGPKHGGNGGNKTAQIKLQYPEEFLTAVMGYYSPLVDNVGIPFVRSLTFKTNRKTYGPYGVQHGTPFSLPVEGGKFVGFNGKSGLYLDAIGFHLAPC